MLLLLALALARPAMRSSQNKVLGQSKVTAVLLLDNSYSMGMSDGVLRLQYDSVYVAGELWSLTLMAAFGALASRIVWPRSV